MESIAQLLGRAVGAYRLARAHLLDIEAELGALAPQAGPAGMRTAAQQQQIADRLHGLAHEGLPGWLGAPLDALPRDHPLGIDAAPDRPMYLRIGDAQPEVDSGFWAVVPFLGAGHLAIDDDVRDPAVAAWLRGVLLRCVAALPDGALRVLPVDGATLGAVFRPFRPLVQAQLWAEPVTDVAGLRTAFAEAERQITAVQAGEWDNPPLLLVAIAALPAGVGTQEWARLGALAHAGPEARVHLLVAGYPPVQPYRQAPPRLERASQLTAGGQGWYWLGEPPGQHRFSAEGKGLPAPLRLDAGADENLVAAVCQRAAATASVALRTDFSALLPERVWQESSVDGLRAVVGRAGRVPYELVLGDATPHMLIAGRSGAGKTNALLVMLYTLASRYSPDELWLYLLDFKEGVSFVEFTPTRSDPSWVPHARTVGIESDREYGLAVLRALAREMNRRAAALKNAGVTKLAELRAAWPEATMPRLLLVVDEFQVLFAGNDAIARESVEALEDLARKGRSYGIHLILASQTIAGIEALYTKKDSIFGQFPLRVALPGGAGILEDGDTSPDALPVGSAVINEAAGVAGAGRVVGFPHADQASVTTRRHLLWEARDALNEPPAVFAGYAEHHIEDDALYTAFTPRVRRRQAVIGRAVDIGLPTIGFALDAVPGRHLAALGTSAVGADILHAAVLGLARQHQPGSVRFVLSGFATAADAVLDDLVSTLEQDGHVYEEVDAGHARKELAGLADAVTVPPGTPRPEPLLPTYLVLFAADVIVPMLTERDQRRRTGLDDLRTVLRQGPGHGVHLLSWWRIARRFTDAVGGAAGREDVACLVALNVSGSDLATVLGDHTLNWQPRPNRALLLDRHDQRVRLVVPFVRPGRHDGVDADTDS